MACRPEITDKKQNVGNLSFESLTYSVPEAGRLLGLGRNASYQAAATGELPTIKIGGRILVPRVALEQLLANAVKP